MVGALFTFGAIAISELLARFERDIVLGVRGRDVLHALRTAEKADGAGRDAA